MFSSPTWTPSLVFTILSLVFFRSGRRRHTRWPRDWSSDVCSSDLLHVADLAHLQAPQVHVGQAGVGERHDVGPASDEADAGGGGARQIELADRATLEDDVLERGSPQVDPVELAADESRGADIRLVDVQRPE